MSHSVPAPLCPEPPEEPKEGERQHLPLSIPLQPYQLCSVNADWLEVDCPSFLSVYFTKITYGRLSEAGKQLCDGNKPKDVTRPTQDCFDDAINEDVKNDLVPQCHGGFNCSVNIPTIPFGVIACDGMKREARIEYICGRIK